MQKTPILAIVYDGQCALCTQSMRLVRQFDRPSMFDYVNAQDRAGVADRWPTLDLDGILGQIHVITPDGAVYVGYSGVCQIAGKLPRIRLIAPVMGWPGIAWIGDKTYRWVAAHRYQFNRLLGKADICASGTCAVPKARAG